MKMDYKYIEQLLDRYFECQTTLEEEQILRAFFAQEDIPMQLIHFRSLFSEAARGEKEDTLGDDFDARILSIIGEEAEEPRKPLHVKALIVPLNRRMRPLYKAAACVAVVLALGQAAQMPYNKKQAEQDNVARIQQMEKNSIRQDANKVAQGDSAAVKAETKTEL